MSKKSFSQTFGAAKPLPGQQGYGISQSQQLEMDAKEMEMRLLALKGLLFLIYSSNYYHYYCIYYI